MRNTTTLLLDEIREEKGLASDYKLAKLLNVRQQTLTNYRAGRTQMNDEIALRAARMIGRNPGLLLVQLAADRAKNPDVARAWKDVAKMLGRAKPAKG